MFYHLLKNNIKMVQKNSNDQNADGIFIIFFFTTRQKI